MLLNCKKCKALTLDYVNKASGLELHRFLWLGNENEIGEINGTRNFLVDVQEEIMDALLYIEAAKTCINEKKD